VVNDVNYRCSTNPKSYDAQLLNASNSASTGGQLLIKH